VGSQAYARTAGGMRPGAGWGSADSDRGAPIVDGDAARAMRAGWGSGTGPGGDAGRLTVERAVGLLAGRARCRTTEAYRHLLRMASERRCDVADLAGRVVRLMDNAEAVADIPAPETVPQLVAAALAGSPEPVEPGPSPWLAVVQGVLDSLPGMSGYLTADVDDTGRLVDLVWAAASPEAVTPDGRRGAQLIGLPVSRHYPEVIAGDRWQVYQGVLNTGVPADLGPVRVAEADFSIRAGRLGPGLLISWERLPDPDREADRIDGMEQLGNLGWGEWDLVSGEIYWSPHLYRIYERDPALGPLGEEESNSIAVAEDQPLRAAALEAFHRSERVDVVTRVLVGGRVKHLRTVADAVRDTEGRPLRIYGIVQDVTEQQAGAARLAEVERTLAAEHDLAARLQRIILPIPADPIDLPGMRVAVRYLPAGPEAMIGGDWYHAAPLRDGSVLLAIGDVAGHGTHAATTMAQMRHALRALAVITSDPGMLLEHLNRLMCELEADTPELAATAVIARFDPARRELVWAQAGHPPPLLSRGGRTLPLARPAGPMLGVIDDARFADAVIGFVPGDVLLLYTDGLVEHRRRGLDVGLDTVIATVDDAVRASPEQPLAELLGRLRRANPDDDTCILAARPRG
jgi:serine phosphatase RsbU (regulator of sigma subunit)/PAS domain-containing protein